MRLHFFPALLPLSSLLPGLLAAVGLAGSIFHTRRGKLAIGASFGLAGIGLALVSHFVAKPGAPTTPTASLPRLATVETLPPVDTRASHWSQLLPRAALSTPAVSEKHGLLIFGTWQSTVDALSLRDGRLAFSLKLSEPSLTEPLIHIDRVYVGEGLHEAGTSRLIAFELPTGTPLWQREFTGHLESAPRLTLDGRSLLGCAGPAGVYSVREQDGVLQWQQPLGHCDSTPWQEGDTVYALVASSPSKSRLVHLDLASGKRRSDEASGTGPELPGQPWGTPVRDAATDALVFTTGRGNLQPQLQAGEQGWLHAYDLGSHRLRWSVELGGMPLLPTLDGIVSLKKGELLSVDLESGAIRWRKRLRSLLLSVPSLIPGTRRISALGWDGTAYELDADSGRILSEYPLAQGSFSSPVFGLGQIFHATPSAIFGAQLGERR